MQKYRVLIGTYSSADEPGIFVCDWDEGEGSLHLVQKQEGVKNPSFLAKHPTKPWLYSVSEGGAFRGTAGGGVVAYAWDERSGQLQPLNDRPTGGGGACHVSVERGGRFVFVANYGGGSLAVFPIEADGSLGERTAFIQHTGEGPNPKRQEAAHVHSVMPDPWGDRIYVADLGLDRVFIYQLDVQSGDLTAQEQPWVPVAPGAGPRHLEMTSCGRFVYVINELDSTITALRRHLDSGHLEPIQSISTLPAGWEGHNQCSDIHLHPSGRFLYGANRGHNSIAVFALDAEEGTLELVEVTGTEGDWPRNFAIHPTGDWLLAANEESHTVQSFRLHAATGSLEHVGTALTVSKPVCVLFVPVA